MRCPRCAEVELHTESTLGGVEVDLCPQCQGVWLDGGELDALLGGGQKAPLEREGVDGTTACPRCDIQWLRVISLPGRPVLQVDRCPDCQGVWLDAGELAGLRARMEPSPTAVDARVLRTESSVSTGRPWLWVSVGWVASLAMLIGPYVYLLRAVPGHPDLAWQYPLCALAYVLLGAAFQPRYDTNAFRRFPFGYAHGADAHWNRLMGNLALVLMPGQVVAWTVVSTWQLLRSRE